VRPSIRAHGFAEGVPQIGCAKWVQKGSTFGSPRETAIWLTLSLASWTSSRHSHFSKKSRLEGWATRNQNARRRVPPGATFELWIY